VGDAGVGTTLGPGSRDSSPLPKARRFSASFSLSFADPVFSAVLSVVLSTVAAFDVLCIRRFLPFMVFLRPDT
jgi:hypothetical protein